MSEIETISSAEVTRPESGRVGSSARLKRTILIAALCGGLIILGAAAYFLIRKYLTPVSAPKPQATSTPAVISSPTAASLPDFNRSEATSTALGGSELSGTAVEYLTFEGFYQKPETEMLPRPVDYALPLNVKIDVMNYYDVSRKLELDPALDSLNNYSFGSIANPWPQEADFYALYASLSSRQLPILLTSDFLIYYEQNIFKKLFKDTEENVFYDNLWDINKEMFTLARDRYEARLAAIGDVNDSVLEGERLETAFFATALELMKPAANQTARKGAASSGLFASDDSQRFYFVVPPYLRDDVLAEVKLIREAKGSAKSPVMRYQRNYTDFVVPSDYLADAKLNNFYLATRWFNSVFPLDYRTKDCPDCLLDKADWRINLTAASLISSDFSNLPDLKNKWARIYKVVSFFKGLRQDLSYVQYRDSLVSLFGEKYDITSLFDDQNKQAAANLEKLKSKLKTFDFSEIAGGLSKSDPVLRPRLGFKMLAEPFWPNTYIYTRLTAPAVGPLIASTTPRNLTYCQDKKVGKILRCNGIALDAVNLAYPVATDYFKQNSNYEGYGTAAQELRSELFQEPAVWHSTNYWTTLNLIKAYAGMDRANLPLFARSSAWSDKVAATAAGAWINLQLPLDKYTAVPSSQEKGLDNFSRWTENSYIEPNLDLVNEMAATNNMLLQMFSALQLEGDVRSAIQDVRNFSDRLAAFRVIVKKELDGTKLSEADNEQIADFIKQVQVSPAPITAKQLAIKLPTQKTVLREDLSRLKLLLLIHEEDGNKILSVGPVWDYKESR